MQVLWGIRLLPDREFDLPETLQHIVEEPEEAKFRRLREKPLERRLGALLPHCVGLLETAGFEKLSIDAETALVLWHSDLGALRSVLSLVQHQHDALRSFGAASGYSL